MPDFNTLSKKEKLDLVLKTSIAIPNGMIANKTLTKSYKFDVEELDAMTNLLQLDGLIEIRHDETPDEWQKISVTIEGRKFAGDGSYAENEILKLDDYTARFHKFSGNMHRLAVKFFWIVTTALLTWLLYMLLSLL